MSAPKKETWDFQPPVFLGGFFGKDSDSDSDTDTPAATSKDGDGAGAVGAADRTESAHEIKAHKDDRVLCPQQYETRTHNFPLDQSIVIREVSFHHLNANFVWPGAFHLATWLSEPAMLASLKGKRILEIGCATGCLSIFLRNLGLDVTTSDYNDKEITDNVAHNFKINKLDPVPHIAHTWGLELDALDAHMHQYGPFDIIIASDIMNYEKAYPDLVKSLDRLYMSVENRKQYAGSVDKAPPAKATSAADTKSIAEATSKGDAKSEAKSEAGDRGDAKSASASDTAAAPSSGEAKGKGKGRNNGKGDGKGSSKVKTHVEDAPDASEAAARYRMIFYMSWQRRHKHRPEEDFFGMLKAAGGFHVWTRGQRIYEIVRDGC